MVRQVAWLLLVLTGCLADKLLLWPPKAAPASHAQREVLHGPDGSIEVFVASSNPGTEPAAFVLCFYGNAQLANEAVAYDAAAFSGLGLELWGVNYPGFGGSKGKATLRGVAASARLAYAAIAKRANGRPILAVGNSLGATAALHVAAHEKLAGVVLHNPPPLRQLILRRHGWWNLWLLALPTAAQVPDQLDSLRNAARARAPAIFVSSSEDGVVPFGYQQRVMKAYGGPWDLIELRGAGHNDPIPEWARVKMIETVISWIPAVDGLHTYRRTRR